MKFFELLYNLFCRKFSIFFHKFCDFMTMAFGFQRSRREKVTNTAVEKERKNTRRALNLKV